MAARRFTATPVGSAETSAGSAPACHADAAGTSSRRPAGAVRPTGTGHRPLSPASTRTGSLVNPTATTRAAASPVAAVGATAASSAGTCVCVAAGPA